VPFCRLVCAYCDFVTVGGRGHDVPRYVDALLDELSARPAPGELRTIYFGGGTPSLLPAEDVERLIWAARTRWALVDVEEVTLEANPSRREAPDWPALRAAGVTRVSLGVQSLDDRDLRALARGHSAAEAIEAFAAARAAAFDNVSIDLIYGIPDQSLDRWRDNVAAAMSLGPDHVSLYALQVVLDPDEWAAPPRPGALRWRRRVAGRQDDALAAGQYGLAEEMLDAAGYRHYELSSWARPGKESRHNQAYWTRRPYTGIGAGAHSFDGGGMRSWNVRDLDAYLERVRSGATAEAGREILDDATRAFEALALGLRHVAGTSRRAFVDEFGVDPRAAFGEGIDEAVAAGLLELGDDVVRLTTAGRLLASEVLEPMLPPGPPHVDSASRRGVPFASAG
jgi:oxygen-independent coproporphyrinogen-3 oxidase